MRRLEVGAHSFTPVAAAMRWASASGAARSASVASSSMVGSPRRSRRAMSRTTCGATCGAGGTGRGRAGTPPGFQQVSDGRMRVAMVPGEVRAACTAAAASAPTSAAWLAVRTQPETPRAQPSVSAVSGASSGRWWVAWSPTQFTIMVVARRALCRLHRPFARPGPQCSRVAAGLPAMRA